MRRRRPIYFTGRERGQSMVQVLIAIGIMGIVAAGFSSMIGNQQRSMTQVEQKMATLDMERTITAARQDPTGVCTFMVNNPTLAPIDPLALPSAISFTQIPVKAVVGSPSVVQVSSTVPASPLSNSLFVSSIALTDLVCIPTPCTATSSQNLP